MDPKIIDSMTREDAELFLRMKLEQDFKGTDCEWVITNFALTRSDDGKTWAAATAVGKPSDWQSFDPLYVQTRTWERDEHWSYWKLTAFLGLGTREREHLAKIAKSTKRTK